MMARETSTDLMAMRILILGATGSTGQELVRQALAAGVLVTAFGRKVSRLPAAGPTLRVVQGDVADYGLVADAVHGQDGVISTLGVARPLHPDPTVVEGIRHTLKAMHEHSVRRLVYLSFIGVAESRPSAGFVIRHIARHPLRHEIADHEVKEGLISSSGLDWTIVRAPKLSAGPQTGRYRVGEAIAAQSLFPVLSRADVASFMLRQLDDRAYVQKAARILP